jgi:hypothetical protein
MYPHDRFWNVLVKARQEWRAFDYVMQVHENHYTKRAGVAGLRARAHGFQKEIMVFRTYK